ncbi:type III polyketide synthase [Xanthovirga aplysinae]|uniref:type III polyketide synthase n=1 Tax=Xanthovirga aplysinae TaxID=2529853 RepID=UPI0012BC57FA|nr:type III polyketide synthase [Xanthovirga aplysinae]MTI31933.1 type III polyketide synthase [Xanthovirga aplysinae]
MSYITSIGSANPAHKIPQSQIAHFMARAFQMNSKERYRQNILYRASGIKFRHSVIEDYGRQESFHFFPDNKHLSPFPPLSKRMDVFKREALLLSVKAIDDCLEELDRFHRIEITHLITVSCTGMHAPGLDIDLVEALNLNHQVERLAINFMGCYAAINALKCADSFCKANENAKVLIVCTELCTLHFQKEPTEDNILANALFADGAAAILVQNIPTEDFNLSLEGFCGDLAFQGRQDMAWQPGNFGFEMKLSAYVPDIIQQGISKLTNTLLNSLSLNLEEIDFFAVHPGGRRILQVIEEELQIGRNKNRFSHEVLQQYGNMSSATILFVLQAILKELKTEDKGKNILSFAFGPGLSMESMLLKIVGKQQDSESSEKLRMYKLNQN